MKNLEWIVVLTTTSSEAEAEKLSESIVSKNLAACVAISPVRSIYRWQGKLCKEPEWQLAIKTRQDIFERLSQTIEALHSYDTPEIIALPILAGSSDYLNWIDQQVNSSKFAVEN